MKSKVNRIIILLLMLPLLSIGAESIHNGRGFKVETSRSRLSVSDGSLRKVVRKIKRRGPAYARCALIKEIKKTYLCIFAKKKIMNYALMRAGLYIEKDLGVLSDKEFLNHDLNNYVVAHDYMAARLREFHGKYKRARSAFKAPRKFRRALHVERRFWKDFVLPRVVNAKPDDYILISIGADVKARVALTHELLHAQYFSNPRFQKIVAEFWKKKVSKADKKEIKETFKDYYDVKNVFLLHNEFQAYTLQGDNRPGGLDELLGKYREPLTRALAASKISIVMLKY